MKAGPKRTLADDYLARSQALGRGIGFSITLTEFAESKAPTAAGRMADELKSFTGLLTDRSFTVVLDERGKQSAIVFPIRAESGSRRIERPVQHRRAAAIERMREWNLRVNPPQPMLFQFQRAEKRRGDPRGMHG